MFVKYNPKEPHVKTIPIVVNTNGSKSIPLANDFVMLRPGTNELTEREWEAIQPHVQNDIQNKVIVPFTVEVKKAGVLTKARTLKDVPVSVARKIIESCQNVNDLKKWVKQELPDEIMLLVLKRLRKFRIDPDEYGDDLSGENTLDDDITPEGNYPGPEVEKADTGEDLEIDDEDSGDEETGSGTAEPTGDSNTTDDEDEIPDFDKDE